MSIYRLSAKLSEDRIFFQDTSKKQYSAGELLTSISFEGRPVIDLSGIAKARMEEVLCALGFSKEALQKIYAQLKQEDFVEQLSQGKTTVERGGFSKKEHQAKFYVILEEPLGKGGFKTCFRAYSRKGTPRAFSKLNDLKNEAKLKWTHWAGQLFRLNLFASLFRFPS